MKILDRTRHERLGETVVTAESESGMRLLLCPKPGFSTSAACFGLRFGSTDTGFRLEDGRQVEVPPGSAHYLEHKLFEGKEEKVFDRFGRLGASFNGGTSFRTTTYYFQTSSRFQECLEVLLDFVQHPWITEERVEKERGIIEQEVRMYADNPNFRGTFLLLRSLYEKHGVRIDPGGSVEDVRAITAAHLQDCFDAFYCPKELRLAMAGDFDVDQVLADLEPLLDVRPNPKVERIYPQEGALPHRTWVEEEFSVQRPKVWLGWREEEGVRDPRERLRQRLTTSLALDLAFDLSSDLHRNLYERGVIDDSFGAYWSSDVDWGHVIAQGVCDDPQPFTEELNRAVAGFAAEGPSNSDFDRLKRASMGKMVSGIETPYTVANTLLSSELNGNPPFCVVGLLEEIGFQEVRDRVAEMFDPARQAVAVLKPQQEDGSRGG